MSHEERMKIAINEALKAVDDGDGGPFGAVIVQNDEVLSTAHSEVLKRQDSVVHAVILAIQEAEKRLGSHDLSGCSLYTVNRPCPMCLGACLNAGIDHVYYGVPHKKTSEIGFSYEKYQNLVESDSFKDKFMTQVGVIDCLRAYEHYLNKQEKQGG